MIVCIASQPGAVRLEEPGLARAGRIVNEKALRQRVFYSGVAADIRKEVWKFLLGLYPAASTAAERADILKQKRLHYGRIKAQWTSIAPEQAAKCVLSMPPNRPASEC